MCQNLIGNLVKNYVLGLIHFVPSVHVIRGLQPGLARFLKHDVVVVYVQLTYSVSAVPCRK